MEIVKKPLYGFILYSMLLLLLFPHEIYAHDGKEHEKEYASLIQTYQKCLHLENEIFKKLTFRLSSVQLVRKGTFPKFILEDNLGRKWIFKPNSHGRPGAAVVVYRIFKLFGLDTPEIHPITLKINDENIDGDIQRFIPNKGTLYENPFSNLSFNCLNYLMKTHVLACLLNNYDAHPTNFLVVSLDKDGKAESIMRVDNEIAFIVPGQDILKNSDEPVQKSLLGTFNNYYYDFFKAYKTKEIDLDLGENFAFVKFVRDFPDTFFEKLMAPVIHNNFEEFSRTDFGKFRENNSVFFEPVILNKQNLSNGFSGFYRTLSSARNETLRLPEKTEYKEFVRQISGKLMQNINELKKEEAKIKNKSAVVSSPSITVIFNYKGFQSLDHVYGAYWKTDKKDLVARCDSELNKLSWLESVSTNKYERAALRLYREEIEKIRSGGNPSFPQDDINKVVDPVPTEELE